MEHSEIACNNPLIVEQIFVNLPLSVLHKCARVCTLWNRMVKRVKNRRQRLFWTSKVDQLEAIEDLQYAFDLSDKPRRLTVDVGAHLHQMLSNAPSEPQLVLMLICNSIKRKVKDAFYCYFNIKSKYSMCFEDSDNSEDNESAENSKDLVKSESISDRKRPKPKHPVMDFLARQLPRDCKVVSAFVNGFVSTYEDFRPQEFPRCAGFTAVCFPTISDVEMFHFTYVETYSSYRRGKMEAHITGLPKNKDIKCILLFVNIESFSKNILRSIQEDYQTNKKCGIALGGVACLREVMSSHYYHTEVGQNSGPEIATGVAFAGANVRAASVVLQRNDEEHDQVFQKLYELKACNLPEENCIAFLFANVINGMTYDTYAKQRTSEIRAFHSIFPKVPLFGTFGEWVFWMEHFSNNQNGNDLNSAFGIDSEFSEKHSVFVLLSFGKR